MRGQGLVQQLTSQVAAFGFFTPDEPITARDVAEACVEATMQHFIERGSGLWDDHPYFQAVARARGGAVAEELEQQLYPPSEALWTPVITEALGYDPAGV